LGPPPLRRGFCLNSEGKAFELHGMVGSFVLTGAHWESHESLSEVMADRVLSSEAWEEVSDQIEALEVDADDANAVL
jgi:hypothetical protein